MSMIMEIDVPSRLLQRPSKTQTPQVANRTNQDYSLREPALVTGSSQENTSSTPAVVVQLGGASQQPPDTFSMPASEYRVATRFTSDEAGKPASHALTQALATRPQRSFSVSSYLALVGQLSGEVNRYQNEARFYTVNTSSVNEAARADFNTQSADTLASFNLVLKTVDGDRILLRITNGRAADFTNIDFSFSVEGDLSDREREALGEFAQTAATVADRFFQTGEARLDNLSFVDRTVFAGFSLDLKNPAGIDKEEQSVSYDFNIDDNKQTQTLNTEANGYQVEATVSLDSRFNSENLSDNRQLLNYLSLIEATGKEYGTSQSDIEFLVDSFKSLLLSTESTTPDDYVQKIPGGDNSLEGFFSGIADFSANFTSDAVRPNRQAPADEVQSMALSMTQQTQADSFRGTDGYHEVFTQTFSFDRRINIHKPLAGLKEVDFDQGNYIYENRRHSETHTRTLERTDGLLSDLTTERLITDSIRSKKVVLGVTQETFSDTNRRYAKATLDQLSRQLDNTAKLLSDLEKIMARDELEI